MGEHIIKYIYTIIILFICLGAKANTCIPNFEYRKGWLGGDGIYSTQLSNQNTLWIFGDSFVDATETMSRHDSLFVPNSVGISKCINGKFKIEYYWDTFKFVIPTGQREYKLWPKDLFTHNQKLYIIFDKVGYVDDFHQGGLGFEIIGTKLAIISNPLDSPNRWKIEYITILNSKYAHTGVSIIKKDGYAYMLTVLGNDLNNSFPEFQAKPMGLQRISLNKMQSIGTEIEYLAKDGSWKYGNNFNDFKIILDQGATELSLRYHHNKRKWVITMLEPVWFSNKIITREAGHLSGPWSAPQTIYEIPEMIPGHPSYSSNTFCYAVKEHYQFFNHATNEMIITYACNSLDPSEVMDDNSIYRPITIKLKID